MDRVRKLIGLESDDYKCGYTGKGVGVAILDSGLCIENKEVGQRVAAFQDFVAGREHCYDDNGHGTHVAGIIGGDGRHSGGRYKGVAPGCHFIVGKALDEKGNGTVSNVARGIEWLLRFRKAFNIRILNISIGMFSDVRRQEQEALLDAVEQAWDAGIVVVVAAGNNGPAAMTVTYPGISPRVITVGALRERQVQRYYSGRGPTNDCVIKPEILAPGQRIVSCKNAAQGYDVKSGSSMATPVVAGAIALLLEKSPYLSPVEVKISLHDTAMDQGLSKDWQGWGMIDVRRLLNA